MATLITEDFVVRNGIVIQGTNVVTSSTEQSNALQVNGGAAIAANLIVGTTASIGSSLTVGNDLTVGGNFYYTGSLGPLKVVTATGFVSITTTTVASTGTGALVVQGGMYLGKNLIVSSTASSTSTTFNNALYVAGGVAIDKSLVVKGPAIFQSDVVFTGGTTYVLSTDTVYTDNIIELHVPGYTTVTWKVDDGLSIGLRFHYFNGTDTNAALILDNSSKYLEWYDANADELTGTFSTATYGTFKTANIKLVGTDTSLSTDTGALSVVGGAGIGGSIYAGEDINGKNLSARGLTQGRIVIVAADGRLSEDFKLNYNTLTNLISGLVENSTTSTNIAGGARGSLPYQTTPGTTVFLPIGEAGLILLSQNGIPTWSTPTGLSAGSATTASNIANGFDGWIPFQNGPGSTVFDYGLRYEYNQYRFSTVNAVFTGTTNAISTNTGTLTVVGGVGLGGNLYIGGDEVLTGDLQVNGGDITTRNSTFNLINSTATVVNFAGSATAITVGNNNGYFVIKNSTTITNSTNSFNTGTGALQVRGGVGIGKNLNVNGSTWIEGNLNVNGGNFTANVATFNLINSTATVVNFAGSATAITIGSTIGNTVIQTSVDITNSTTATSTITGALNVSGGVGIQGDVYIGGNTYFTNTLIPLTNTVSLGTLAYPFSDLYLGPNSLNIDTIKASGVGSTLTFTSTLGSTVINVGAAVLTTSTNSLSTASGALQVTGGAGIGQDLWIGGNEFLLGNLKINGGNLTTDQTTFNLINSTATTINFAGSATAITIGSTNGYVEIKNITTVTNSTNSSNTSTGALQVRGGVGIGKNLNVNGSTVLSALTATITTLTNLTVNGTSAISGIATFTEGSNATAPYNGSVNVTGGIGLSKDLIVGGQITAGYTQAATSGTSVSSLYSNNNLQASFTSGVITGNTQVNLDTFSSTVFRSAKYFVQIVDGSNIHISEISVFHDGVNAYINEYGISSNNGQLGVFDATWNSTTVTIKFRPTNATNMIIKMVRTTITL